MAALGGVTADVNATVRRPEVLGQLVESGPVLIHRPIGHGPRMVESNTVQHHLGDPPQQVDWPRTVAIGETQILQMPDRTAENFVDGQAGQPSGMGPMHKHGEYVGARTRS
jgi:hypothetical protein